MPLYISNWLWRINDTLHNDMYRTCASFIGYKLSGPTRVDWKKRFSNMVQQTHNNQNTQKQSGSIRLESNRIESSSACFLGKVNAMIMPVCKSYSKVLSMYTKERRNKKKEWFWIVVLSLVRGRLNDLFGLSWSFCIWHFSLDLVQWKRKLIKMIHLKVVLVVLDFRKLFHFGGECGIRIEESRNVNSYQIISWENAFVAIIIATIMALVTDFLMIYIYQYFIKRFSGLFQRCPLDFEIEDFWYRKTLSHEMHVYMIYTFTA